MAQRLRLLLTIVVFALAVSSAQADGIAFTLNASAANATPGTAVIFSGTITNDTNETLDAFSLFFDFNNFDPTGLDFPIQILPQGGTDFLIAAGTTSSSVQLFSALLLPTAVSGSAYTLDITLQGFDAEGDTLTGNTETVLLTDSSTGGGGNGGDGGGNSVPEPATVWLLAGAGGVALAMKIAKRI